MPIRLAGRAWRRWTAALFALAFVAACGGSSFDSRADAAEPGFGSLVVSGVPVPLNADNPVELSIGKLRYRGGLRLVSGESRFGGWSDLRVDDDGVVRMISDHGFWLEARLRHDAAGDLNGIADTQFGPLIDTRGRAVRDAMSDAEGLVRLPDGDAIVSFERQHRLWLYPAATPPFSKPPAALAKLPGVDAAPSNGGVEALGLLADGRVIAIAEELYKGSDNVGWIGDQQTWETLTYAAAPGFKPTSAAGLPNGDLLVLERRFSLLGGFGGRLTRVRAADIAAGRRLVGEELARFERPLITDNYEGVAVARNSAGATLVYIVSDDNYQTMLQQTLLLMFELDE